VAQAERELPEWHPLTRTLPLTHLRLWDRYVTKEDVLKTLVKGRVNDRKSDLQARPCAKYAIEVSAVYHRQRQNPLTQSSGPHTPRVRRIAAKLSSPTAYQLPHHQLVLILVPVLFEFMSRFALSDCPRR
jgi:hypothetical protein